jgi:hypothetical protein
MIMPPTIRKLARTAHLTVSVGWLGAVLAFLALAVSAFTASDPSVGRSAYLSMQVIVWSVLVPLAVASLASGVVVSVGTPWGLLRHWWVVFKLLLNVVATSVLMLYAGTVNDLGDLARGTTSSTELRHLAVSPMLHAAAAVLLLLAATVLAVLKPPGWTPLGLRARHRLAVNRAGAPLADR